MRASFFFIIFGVNRYRPHFRLHWCEQMRADKGLIFSIFVSRWELIRGSILASLMWPDERADAGLTTVIIGVSKWKLIKGSLLSSVYSRPHFWLLCCEQMWAGKGLISVLIGVSKCELVWASSFCVCMLEITCYISALHFSFPPTQWPHTH